MSSDIVENSSPQQFIVSGLHMSEQGIDRIGFCGHRSGDMLVGRQISAGRGLAQISVAQLAEAAGVSIATVKRAEAAVDEVPGITAANLARIERALDRFGVEFLSAGQLIDGGVGVRTKRP